MTEMEKPNLWIPITDEIDLAHLGKLAEELGEAQVAVSRCIIQGMDSVDPKTGKVNRQALQDELADVAAQTRLNLSHFELNENEMRERGRIKRDHKREWHRMLLEWVLKGRPKQVGG